jgi:hypothetical protein
MLSKARGPYVLSGSILIFLLSVGLTTSPGSADQKRSENGDHDRDHHGDHDRDQDDRDHDGHDRDGRLEAAIARIAELNGVAQDKVKIVANVSANFPLTGASATEYKAFLVDVNQIVDIALGPDGTVVDPQLLVNAEQVARRARFGKLTGVLYDKVVKASEETSLAVDIWAHEPTDDDAVGRLWDLNGPTPAEKRADVASAVQAQLGRIAARRLKFLNAQMSPLLARLRGLDPGARAVAGTTLLGAHLSPSQIQQVASWEEVDRVYSQRAFVLSSPLFEADLASNAQGLTPLHQQGVTGLGVKVTDLEFGDGVIPLDPLAGQAVPVNPNLGAPLVEDPRYLCGTPGDHSMGVVGVIGSRNGTYPGMAPDALIRLGGVCDPNADTDMQQQAADAVAWGANVFNLSWGRDNEGVVDPDPTDPDVSMARFFDDLVVHNARSVVASAGNSGADDSLSAGRYGCQGDNQPVWSPALAYNLLGVGEYDDNKTIAWADDFRNPCSCHLPPVSTHHDRVKPDVSAPGVDIWGLLNHEPWVGDIGSGTSFASPMVAGVEALTMQVAPALMQWPQAVRAIMKATAVHKITQNDGVKAIYPQAAVDTAQAIGANGWKEQPLDCSTGTVSFTVHLFAGHPTHVALAWDNDPAYALYGSQPGADLDLYIIGPRVDRHRPVWTSASFDNTWELVEFTAPTTGDYTVYTETKRCDFSPGQAGWAWYQEPVAPIRLPNPVGRPPVPPILTGS